LLEHNLISYDFKKSASLLPSLSSPPLRGFFEWKGRRTPFFIFRGKKNGEGEPLILPLLSPYGGQEGAFLQKGLLSRGKGVTGKKQ